MTTKLRRPFRRELDLDGVAHTIIVSPVGIKLTVKGKRHGAACTWKQLLDANSTPKRSNP